jgi:hypothetical protein
MSATQRAFGRSAVKTRSIKAAAGARNGSASVVFRKRRRWPLEPRLAHEPGDPLVAVAVAVGANVGVDAGGAGGAAAHLMDAASRSTNCPCWRRRADGSRPAHE